MEAIKEAYGKGLDSNIFPSAVNNFHIFHIQRMVKPNYFQYIFLQKFQINNYLSNLSTNICLPEIMFPWKSMKILYFGHLSKSSLVKVENW